MSTPRKKNPRERKKSSQRHERRAARALGGRPTSNSGAGFEKGDGRVMGLYRIENKETDNLSFTLKIDELDKIAGEALEAGEIPLMHVRMKDRRGRYKEFAILRFKDFAAMVNNE